MKFVLYADFTLSVAERSRRMRALAKSVCFDSALRATPRMSGAGVACADVKDFDLK